MQAAQLDKLYAIISSHAGDRPELVVPEANFQTTLGMDSIDNVQMIGDINDEFDIQLLPEDLESVRTVETLTAAVNKALNQHAD